jgi:hypothetical protein
MATRTCLLKVVPRPQGAFIYESVEMHVTLQLTTSMQWQLNAGTGLFDLTIKDCDCSTNTVSEGVSIMNLPNVPDPQPPSVPNKQIQYRNQPIRIVTLGMNTRTILGVPSSERQGCQGFKVSREGHYTADGSVPCCKEPVHRTSW